MRIGRKTWIQIALIIPMLASGFVWMGSFGSMPRGEAEKRLGQSLPESWERVVMNHGTALHWPFPKSAFLIAMVLFAACAILLLYTVLDDLSRWVSPNR